MATLDIEGFALRGGESWRSPWSSYRWLRDNDPVHRVDHPELGRFWVLSRFSDVIDAARDTATFSSAQGLTPGPDSGVMFEDGTRPIVMMDPPDHTTMRRLVSRPMTPRMVSPIEPAVRAFVQDGLEEIPVGREIDIVEVLFKPLPSFVVAHYLGVPPHDRTRFDGWTNSIVAANATADLESAADAFLGLFAFGSELIERRKAEPGDDLVSLLVQAGEDAVSAGWIVGFVFTMVTGGNDTTTGLLAGAASLLTERHDQRRLLLDDPALIPGAVEEFLRLTSPVQNLARTTTTDVTLHSTTIPAGDKVMLVYGSANRDERVFGADAGELDVCRRIDRMVSLGYGAHHCLGAAAARLQAAVVLSELLSRFPDFAVDLEAGRFASGAYVRRYESLPFTARP
ncbi:MAG: cytochrome P450 [Acidimicrobiia bacterium]|nr:cytochrome P450 [Acidimicrobiia bacterium]